MTAGVVVALAATLVSACNAAVAPELSATVQSARTALMDAADEPLFAPGLQFREIRCRADGGKLVVFDRLSLFSGGVSFAVQPPGVDGWAGGLAGPDVDSDPEVVGFFDESPEVPCVAPA